MNVFYFQCRSDGHSRAFDTEKMNTFIQSMSQIRFEELISPKMWSKQFQGVSLTPWNLFGRYVWPKQYLPDSIRSAKTVTRAHFSMDNVPEETARGLYSLS